MPTAMQRIRQWAKALKRQVMVLWFSTRHPLTPLLPKLLALLVVAYALSPIDLIPDFIPVLGYLDDLILVPLGVWLAIRLLPAEVLEECREQAAQWERNQLPRPVNWVAATVVILIWLVVAALCWRVASRYWGGVG